MVWTKQKQKILRRGGKNTQNCTKKDLHDPDNHDGMITHLELDILECEVKCALERITTNKTSGPDGIPVELFQILKDDAVKVLHLNMPANLENSAVATGLEKIIFQSNSKERQCQRMFKVLHNCTHFTCYKVMLKILLARLQQYMNQELPDAKAGFRKGRGTRDQIANICQIIEKAKEFQKNIYFWFIDYTKAFDCVDHSKLENS